MSAPKEAYRAPEPVDYIGALKLAIDAGANVEASYRLMAQILDDAPNPPSEALWPTRLLIEAIQNLAATVSVP